VGATSAFLLRQRADFGCVNWSVRPAIHPWFSFLTWFFRIPWPPKRHMGWIKVGLRRRLLRHPQAQRSERWAERRACFLTCLLRPPDPAKTLGRQGSRVVNGLLLASSIVAANVIDDDSADPCDHGSLAFFGPGHVQNIRCGLSSRMWPPKKLIRTLQHPGFSPMAPIWPGGIITRGSWVSCG